MAFAVKAWKKFPDLTTPINAVALIDAEQRLSDYAKLVAPFYNAKDYGITGNGVTDDTAAINAFLLLIKNAGGGTAYFPPGTYLISGPIISDQYVCIVGAGAFATIFKCNHASAVLEFNPDGLTSGTRGGTSGDFSINMNNLSTVGMRVMSVNRNFQSIRINTPAANSRSLLLDDAQNCRFFGVSLECRTNTSGPANCDGVVLDRGASGNWFFGLDTNQYTGTHILLRQSGAPIQSGAQEPTNNMFIGGMIERGPLGTKQVWIRAGRQNHFIHMNYSSNSFTPTAEYPIVVVDEGPDTHAGSLTRNNIFDAIVFNGGLNGSTRHAIGFQLNGSTNAWGHTTVVNCLTRNVKYLFDVTEGHGLYAHGNASETSATALYKPGKGRPNHQVFGAASTLAPGFWARVITLNGSATVNTIDPMQYQPGDTVMIVFTSGATIAHNVGNIKLTAGTSFVGSAGRTLTLMTDGATWYQTPGT